MPEQKTIPEEEKNYAWELPYEDEYSFWEGEEDYNIPYIVNNVQATVNQGMNKKSQSACTIFWCVAALQHLFNIKLSIEEANELALSAVDYCVKNWWYEVWNWRWVEAACKYVTKRWNEICVNVFNKERVFYIRCYWNSPIIKEGIEKWHYIWFSKTASWYNDKVKGLIDKDKYDSWNWHRLNFKSTEQTKATSWLKNNNYDIWVHDNYEWNKGQQFFIKDRSKYIWKWINARCYLFLPESSMINTNIEEEKNKIEEGKAVNALIWSLSTTWWSLPKEFQDKASELAKSLREAYPDARVLVQDEKLKHYQSLVDQLSFNWKWADDEYKPSYAELAKTLREKFWLK